ncbi:unnamed protein product [Toxocara canis]|uniref:GLOBIN domain-containing protein n=1 Tax=Toxocara canis TaxID=6265 RepID=A0A183UVZ9_TOXCA|nr:unnamed protein product [Toxocara canis]
MGQKNSTDVGDDALLSDNDGVSKQDATSANEEEDQREKYPVLCPAYKGIVLECYDNAHGDTAGRIVMRMGQQRDDFRAFMDSLSAQQREILIENLRSYLNAVVENIDDAEEVKELSANYGAFHVRWRANGFKPDFFAITADAIATECVFMRGTATATAPTSTFKAWTILVGLMFSAVRDGYYAELRRHRKSPAHTSDSVESIPSSDHAVEASTYQNGCAKVPNNCENDVVQNSDARFFSSTPPSTRNRDRLSGSPRLSCDGRPLNDSRQSLNDSRPATTSLHREDAFYIQKLPQPYQRSRSAGVNNTAAATSNAEGWGYWLKGKRRRQMPVPPLNCDWNVAVDLLGKRNCMKADLSRQHSEGYLLATSMGASPSSGSDSPIVGRYQKNIANDSDTKGRHRIDEIVRRHEMHRLASNRGSAFHQLIRPRRFFGMRLFSVLLCLVEALGERVAAVLAVTACQMASETQLSAGMGGDRYQSRFHRAIRSCYEGSGGAAVTVKKLADSYFRNGTGLNESCEDNMTLSNVRIDRDRAVYLVMGCANWEWPSQPESDEDSDEVERDEVLAKVASSRTRHADRGKSMSVIVTFLISGYRTRKDKDQETTTGTTITVDPSQQLSGITTIIRNFMEGETVAEQTDLYSDRSMMATLKRRVQPAEGTTTPQ